MSTSSDHQPPERVRQPSTQEIPVVPPAAARPMTGGHHLPPPGAPQTAGTPVPAAQPTGPVDFVPGLPGAGTPPPQAAAGPPAPPPPIVPAPVNLPPGAAPAQSAPATAAGRAAPPTSPVTAPPAENPGWPHSLDADPPVTAKRRRVGTTTADRLALAALGLAAISLGLLQVGLLLRFGTESFWSTVTLWSAFATFASVLALIAFAAFYPAGNRLRSGAMWRIAAAGLVGLSVFWVLVVLPIVASDRGFVLTAALGCLGAALWIGPRRKD